ncbi:MAG TPA: MFS transporter [Anaerolineales bacterium]|nr:MFS transporter [Anaerolineales bacterium]
MSMQSTTDQTRPWAPKFFTIWGGQALSLLGSQLVQFALIWWLTKTSGSGTVLAIASLFGLVPHVILGPFVGTLVDRWNRRVTMILADAVSALAIVVLAVLFALGQAQIWHIYILMFIRSVAGAFHGNAMMASTSLMVPKQHLARIQGLNQMLWGGMSVFSAPLGALLLEVMPLQGILAIDVVTALMAIVPLFFIAVPQPERLTMLASTTGKASFWQDFVSGLKYVWGWPGLLLICLMAMQINFLLNPAFSLLPLVVTKHFNGEAIQLATLESLAGIGTIAGGLVLSAWGGFKRRILTAMTGVIGLGLGCLMMGLLPPSAFTWAVVAMFIVGFVNPITNGPLLAAVQAQVAPDMQGRVFSLISSLAAATSPIGLLIAGPVSDWLGPQAWFIIGGIVTLLTGVTAFFIPAVMRFEDGRGDDAPVELPAAAAVAAQLDCT